MIASVTTIRIRRTAGAAQAPLEDDEIARIHILIPVQKSVQTSGICLGLAVTAIAGLEMTEVLP